MTSASCSPAVRCEPADRADDGFLGDILEGLSRPQKSIPCKYLYDEQGSRLFEQICELESYYITRTETKLLRDRADEMALLIGPDAQIIEPGSGAGEKIRILLSALDGPARFIPIDISPQILERSAAEIAGAFPGIDVHPVHGDFTELTELGIALKRGAGRAVCFFPGSTIGNFTPDEARGLMSRMRQQVGPGGGLLIGVDLRKDRAVLERAYDDEEDVTAAFTLNILAHANHALGADFDLGQFRHVSFFNEREARIEIYLESLQAQTVRIAGRNFAFQPGERIHIENSYKYTLEAFRDLGREAGWYARAEWCDPDGLFSIHYFDN